MTTATPRPVHTSTICQGGTACQAQGIDRRLGDFFTIEIDNSGHVWGGYSDTAEGGATALPGFVHQRAGIPFITQPDAPDPQPDGSGDGVSGGSGGAGGGGGPDERPAVTDPDGDEVAAGAEESSGLAVTGAEILLYIAVALGLILAGWMVKRRFAPKQ